MRRACFDCHSHQTVWPWYSHVAPLSWLIARDVDRGRKHLDFSAWDKPQKHARDAVEQVQEGEMPLPLYLPLHPEARLSDAEKAELIAALRAIAPRGKAPGGGEREEEAK